MDPASLVIALAEFACAAYFITNAVDRKIVSFPVLFIGVWAAFVLPRIWGVEASDHPFAQFFRDNGVVEDMAIFSVLCILFGILGYTLAARHRVYELRPSEYVTLTPKEEQRFYMGALAVLGLGFLGILGMTSIAGGLSAFYLDAQSYNVAWSGPIVYFHFITQLNNIAIACFGFLYFRFKKKKYLVCLALSLLYPLANILLVFRRSDTLLLILLVGYAAVRWGKIRIGRSVALAGVGVLVVVVLAFPVLRGTLRSDQQLSATQLREKTSANSDFDYNTEMAAAAFDFYQINALHQYEYGGIVWNALVQQYVPRGLVGADIKSSMLINHTDDEDYTPGFSRRTYNYIAAMGFTQAYQQFAMLGFFMFLGFGLVIGFLENLAFKSLRMEIVFVAMLPIFVLSVSNDMSIVLPRLVYYIVISLIFLPSFTSQLARARKLHGEALKARRGSAGAMPPLALARRSA